MPRESKSEMTAIDAMYKYTYNLVNKSLFPSVRKLQLTEDITQEIFVDLLSRKRPIANHDDISTLIQSIANGTVQLRQKEIIGSFHQWVINIGKNKIRHALLPYKRESSLGHEPSTPIVKDESSEVEAILNYFRSIRYKGVRGDQILIWLCVFDEPVANVAARLNVTENAIYCWLSTKKKTFLQHFLGKAYCERP